MKLKTFKFTDDDLAKLEDAKSRFGITSDTDVIRRALSELVKEYIPAIIPDGSSLKNEPNPFLFIEKKKDTTTGDWMIQVKQNLKPWLTRYYQEGTPEYIQYDPDRTDMGDVTYEKI